MVKLVFSGKRELDPSRPQNHGRTKALYNFNMVEVFTSLRNLIITVGIQGRPGPPLIFTNKRDLFNEIQLTGSIVIPGRSSES